MKTNKKRRNVRDGTIWFDKYPPDHAQYAFDRGFYIEALQVLHSWLEVKVREWLSLSRHGNKKPNFKEVWASSYELSLIQTATALFILGKMPKSTFDSLRKFNSLRNKLIHRIFYESYENGLVHISFKECETVFRLGMKLSDKMEGQLAQLATRGKP